jgi:hypothetical protein
MATVGRLGMKGIFASFEVLMGNHSSCFRPTRDR